MKFNHTHKNRLSLLVIAVLLCMCCRSVDSSIVKPCIYQITGEAGRFRSIDGDKSSIDLKLMAPAVSEPSDLKNNHDFKIKFTFASGIESMHDCAVETDYIDNIVRQLPNGETERVGYEDIWRWRVFAFIHEPISEVAFISKGNIIASRKFNHPVSFWPPTKAGLTSPSTPPAVPARTQ